MTSEMQQGRLMWVRNMGWRKGRSVRGGEGSGDENEMMNELRCARLSTSAGSTNFNGKSSLQLGSFRLLQLLLPILSHEG